MKRLLLALVLFPAVVGAQHPAPRLASIDSVFDMYRGTENPGCAVGVSRHGRVIHEGGYGMANLETGTPIRPASIFHVASVSKQFTAMAILLLERDGKLSLDDDIRKYLPEMPDYGTRITIRQLLQHTSGIRDQWELLILARGRFEENRITEADVMDIVPRQKALNFAPQTEYMYSNSGYTLAAVIVHRVSGKSLRAFADERIFQPLGMRDTHFHDDYTMIVTNRTWAYAPRQGGGGGLRTSIPNYDTYGATSLFTTVGDLLTWQANFDSLRVGDRALFDAMQRNTVLTNGDSTGYGLGVSLGALRGARFVGHGGADAGYRSWAGRYPDHGLGIAVACNVATANPTALANRIAEAVLRDELPSVAPAGASAPAPAGAPALTAEQAARHAGIYFAPHTQQTLELVARDGGLFVGRTGNARLAPAEDGWLRAAGATSPRMRLVDANRLELSAANSNRVLSYERRREAARTRAALAAYAGEYYSEELNATYRITVQDTTIVFQTGTAEPIVARPLFLDGFAMRNTTVVFTRTGSRITGFEVSGGRVRQVGFTRVR